MNFSAITPAVYDPLAALAEADKARLQSALKDVDKGSGQLDKLVADLAKASGIGTKTKRRSRRLSSSRRAGMGK